MKIAIKNKFTGLYVTAEQGGGLVYIGNYSNRAYKYVAPLYANRVDVGIWETFEQINNSNGTVSFQTYGGQFITAEQGGGFGLSTNRNIANAWEQFYLAIDGIQCINKNYYVTAENGADQHLNASRTSIGAWEQFIIESLEPVVPDIEEGELRAVRGNICGLIIKELQYGPTRPEGRLLWTPGYVVENKDTRKIIREAYKAHNFSHFVVNIRNTNPLYRNYYPNWDESQINTYLEELWNDGLIPVCSVFPDGAKDLNPHVDSSLVKVVFWWEDPYPIKRPANDKDNKFYIAQSAYPDAIIYWHNPPNQDAPYIDYKEWGLIEGVDLANPEVWNYIVRNNNVKGILFQGKAWEGWENSARNIADFIPRFHGSMYGLPFPIDVHDFEETAYYLFNDNGDVTLAQEWVEKIREAQPDIDGYCNG